MMLVGDQETYRNPILRGSEPNEYYSRCRAMSIRKNRVGPRGADRTAGGARPVPERRKGSPEDWYLGLIAKCGFGSIFSGG